MVSGWGARLKIGKTYVMLFDDLLEAGVVQLRELGQVVNVGNDIT